ncbi:MAG: hypothetical protein IPI44_09620 [Sulfuritalea sp.]|nr:hypothetical protein [Sulfuritalea sp.]
MQKSILAVCLGAAILPAVAQSCKEASALAHSLSRNVTVVGFTTQACINQEMTMKTRIESVSKSEGNSPAQQARVSGSRIQRQAIEGHPARIMDRGSGLFPRRAARFAPAM